MIKVIQRHVRPKRPPISPTLIQQASEWINNSKDLYLGFGGIGDALLTIAACWDNLEAKVIFLANDCTFAERFFELFKIPCLVRPNVMGTDEANLIYDKMSQTGRLKISGHLADGLNHEDWRNEEKYKKRIVTQVPWISKFGKVSSQRNIIIIAPHGSRHDEGRQRYLSPDEFNKLVGKYVNLSYDVYSIGSEEQRQQFPLIYAHSYWLTTGKNNMDLLGMLKIINAAKRVISVDSWLKTYSLLVGIPTTVIQTRWHGQYKPYGEFITDWIFLNKNIWPDLHMAPIEELL